MCEVSYGQQLLSSFHGPADPMAFDYRDEWYQHGPIVSSPPKNFNKTDRQGGGGGKKMLGGISAYCLWVRLAGPRKKIRLIGKRRLRSRPRQQILWFLRVNEWKCEALPVDTNLQRYEDEPCITSELLPRRRVGNIFLFKGPTHTAQSENL